MQSDSSIQHQQEYVLSDKAYWSILLHSAKFPHESLFGVLLGKLFRGKESEDVEGKSTERSIVIVKAVPMMHSSIELSPMVEISLQVADMMAKEEEDLIVCGAYFANSRLEDTQIPRFGVPILECIRSSFPSCIGLVLDNTTFDTTGEVYLRPMQWKKEWVEVDALSLESERALTVSKEWMNKQEIVLALATAFVDFEEHVADGRLDFRNTSLLEEIADGSS
eukprot:TRINITY_DN82789_c0_g1_i1.p1 TRINITY_DN82789_c0_g1~~TRINITY_DN82789_c0_g1_i1.p1  ORF type:complete len:258 (-),score=68.21 TRINITY_DN82789_c0_g1_i1:177-842(-)